MQSVPVDRLIGKDAGSYHIERLLGEGPVSSFFEAHLASGQKVILTLFALPETLSPQSRARFMVRFQQEGAALVQLKHPVIMPVYDYGVCMGYPYLATPFGPGSSLARVLQAYGHIPPEAALEILKQVADGLDYASSNGVVHGALSPANILAGQEHGEVRMAGFGLTHILALQGLEPQDAPDAHLLNIAGTFLTLPAYMAPEIIQSVSCSVSADIYALGILLFELLSGKPPFRGETPSEIEQQQAQQSIPSLSALVPTLPASVDAVMQKVLAPWPVMRFQTAGEFVRAFEQALYNQSVNSQPLADNAPRAFEQALYNQPGESQPLADNAPRAAERTDITGPITIDWQAINRANAGKQPSEALKRIAQQTSQPGLDPFAGIQQITPDEARANIAQQATLPGLDPFAWWTNVSATQTVSHPQVNKLTPAAAQRAEGQKQTRRSVVALLTVGSVVVAGLGGSGFVLLRHWQQQQAASQVANSPTQTPSSTSSSTQTSSSQPSPTSPPTPTSQPSPTSPPTPTAASTSDASGTPVGLSTPTATSAPTPTPVPPTPTPVPPTPTPGHTGTVIASTSMAPNSAVNFSGNNVLIHLASGSFVAYSRDCTHDHVPVDYNTGKQELICPAHGAVFSASSGSAIKGPAHKPLSPVPIHVNGDGTITV